MRKDKLEYIVEDEGTHNIMLDGETVFSFDMDSGWHIEKVLMDRWRADEPVSEMQITVVRGKNDEAD